jgi:hypothetical protein
MISDFRYTDWRFKNEKIMSFCLQANNILLLALNLGTQALSTQALFLSPFNLLIYFLFDSYLSNLQFRLSDLPERKTDIN